MLIAVSSLVDAKTCKHLSCVMVSMCGPFHDFEEWSEIM
jgi:hypothetical protein